MTLASRTVPAWCSKKMPSSRSVTRAASCKTKTLRISRCSSVSLRAGRGRWRQRGERGEEGEGERDALRLAARGVVARRATAARAVGTRRRVSERAGRGRERRERWDGPVVVVWPSSARRAAVVAPVAVVVVVVRPRPAAVVAVVVAARARAPAGALVRAVRLTVVGRVVVVVVVVGAAAAVAVAVVVVAGRVAAVAGALCVALELVLAVGLPAAAASVRVVVAVPVARVVRVVRVGRAVAWGDWVSPCSCSGGLDEEGDGDGRCPLGARVLSPRAVLRARWAGQLEL